MDFHGWVAAYKSKITMCSVKHWLEWQQRVATRLQSSESVFSGVINHTSQTGRLVDKPGRMLGG